MRSVRGSPTPRRAPSSPPTAAGSTARSSNSKKIADQAAERAPSVEKLIVVRRTAQAVEMRPGRDLWWHELMTPAVSTQCETVPSDAEDLFFTIYTSGSTGAPKGIAHTVGGYLVDVHAALKWVLDFKPGDTLFCTSDAGWIEAFNRVVWPAHGRDHHRDV